MNPEAQEFGESHNGSMAVVYFSVFINEFVCLSAGGSELESDFNWDEYLEENGVLAVPHHAFKHVCLITLHQGPFADMVLIFRAQSFLWSWSYLLYIHIHTLPSLSGGP